MCVCDCKMLVSKEGMCPTIHLYKRRRREEKENHKGGVLKGRCLFLEDSFFSFSLLESFFVSLLRIFKNTPKFIYHCLFFFYETMMTYYHYYRPSPMDKHRSSRGFHYTEEEVKQSCSKNTLKSIEARVDKRLEANTDPVIPRFIPQSTTTPPSLHIDVHQTLPLTVQFYQNKHYCTNACVVMDPMVLVEITPHQKQVVNESKPPPVVDYYSPTSERTARSYQTMFYSIHPRVSTTMDKAEIDDSIMRCNNNSNNDEKAPAEEVTSNNSQQSKSPSSISCSYSPTNYVAMKRKRKRGVHTPPSLTTPPSDIDVKLQHPPLTLSLPSSPFYTPTSTMKKTKAVSSSKKSTSRTMKKDNNQYLMDDISDILNEYTLCPHNISITTDYCDRCYSFPCTGSVLTTNHPPDDDTKMIES